MGPLESIYFFGYALKKSQSLRTRRKLPARVISVGNLTVGGTGKTPATMAIAEEALRRGYRPCILTRGYRGRAKGPCFVSRGEGPLMSADDAGDEAFLMAERLKGIPVVKGSDRYEAGMFALRHLDPDFTRTGSKVLFLLDDGFQHWRLARDLDVLLIDATDPFGNRRLLPAGRLREPIREMGRADLIVISKKPPRHPQESGRPCPSPMDRLIDEIRDYNPTAPLYMAEHVAAGLRTLSGQVVPLNALTDKRVFGFCGLGNPASFRNTLQGVKVRLVGDLLSFRDHVRYTPRHIAKIRQEALTGNVEWIVTTEKDIMKLKALPVPQDLAPILVSLRIDFSIDTAFYENVFSASP